MQVNFLNDRLFCEWAYFIDFENRKLETYQSGVLVNTKSFKNLGPGTMVALENGETEEEEDEEGKEDEEEEEKEEKELDENRRKEVTDNTETPQNLGEEVKGVDGAWVRMMAVRGAASAKEN